MNRRILLVDDNLAIHQDFQDILDSGRQTDTAHRGMEDFHVDSAMQGREALELVTSAVQEKRPYAMAFVDVRMPPGWDGIETIEHLWSIDPALQIVLCTAYSDYSWEKMAARLGINDKLIILKKPFDNIEVIHLARALTSKWNATHEVDLRQSRADPQDRVA